MQTKLRNLKKVCSSLKYLRGYDLLENKPTTQRAIYERNKNRVTHLV